MVEKFRITEDGRSVKVKDAKKKDESKPAAAAAKKESAGKKKGDRK